MPGPGNVPVGTPGGGGGGANCGGVSSSFCVNNEGFVGGNGANGQIKITYITGGTTYPGGNGANGQILLTYTTGTTFSGGNGSAGQISITYTPTTAEAAIWCANLNGTPGATVTVSLTGGSTTAAGGNVSEWSGTTCNVDGAGVTNTGTSATPATATLATSNATDLLIAAAFRSSTSGSLSSGPTNSYTAFNTTAANNDQAYRVVSSTGSYTTSWTHGASNSWSTVSAALPAFTGGVCGGQFSAQLVGSYNSPGTVLPSLALPTQVIAVQSNGAAGNNVIRTYQATGAYPALNIFLPIYDPTNCVYDIFYSGVIGGSVGNAITNNNSLLPKTFTVSSSGDTTLLTAASQYYMSVYGASVCNKTAAQTVTLQSATTGTTGLVTYAVLPNMAAGQCVLAPLSQLPVWSARAARTPSTQTSTLVMNLSAASEVDVELWYQFE